MGQLKHVSEVRAQKNFRFLNELAKNGGSMAETPLMSVKQLFDPMLCQAVDLEELKKLGEADTHVFQPKYDGIRIIGYKGDDKYFILNRNKDDVTAKFPEACESLEKLPSGTLVDGELVRFVDGKPSFEAVTHRISLTNMETVYSYVESEPLTFVAFDLLAISNKMLNGYALEYRLDVLSSLPLTQAETTEDLNELLNRMEKDGWEGVVAKDKSSKYEFGRRSAKWAKYKFRADG